MSSEGQEMALEVARLGSGPRAPRGSRVDAGTERAKTFLVNVSLFQGSQSFFSRVPTRYLVFGGTDSVDSYSQ